MALTLLLAGIIVSGILVHTYIVHRFEFAQAAKVCDTDVLLAQILRGQTTTAKIDFARQSQHSHRAEVPDASGAFRELPKLS
jgi:hypothetical protein